MAAGQVRCRLFEEITQVKGHLLSTVPNFGNSPSARPNVRSPWALFTLLYLKFHGQAFLQTIKVHLLKTVAVKENLSPI
jgi:hypothetical protein